MAAARRKREEADWSLDAGGRDVGSILFPIVSMILSICSLIWSLVFPLLFHDFSVGALGDAWRRCLSTIDLYGESLPTLDIKRID